MISNRKHPMFAKLQKAQIIVSNGAGYDSWATKSVGRNSTIVSAAETVGAMEGDNPHLWFSKDARNGMATELTEAFSKALPAKKKAFQSRLKAWQKGGKGHREVDGRVRRQPQERHVRCDGGRGVLPDVGHGLPGRHSQGVRPIRGLGREPAPADLQEFQSLIESQGISVLVNNTQEASDATNMITGAAGRADVPVVDVSEQMPKDADTLNAWINQLINTIIDAVDPSYGCEDATDGDTADSNANSDDSSAKGSATDDANAQDSKASTGSSTDPKYIRQCKAAASSDSSQDSAKADAANGDPGDASGNDQTDSGK